MSKRMTFDPNPCRSRLCLRVLRIRVYDILDLLATKVPESGILEDYPYPEQEDIAAC